MKSKRSAESFYNLRMPVALRKSLDKYKSGRKSRISLNSIIVEALYEYIEKDEVKA
jgi:hypothetical protein